MSQNYNFSTRQPKRGRGDGRPRRDGTHERQRVDDLPMRQEVLQAVAAMQEALDQHATPASERSSSSEHCWGKIGVNVM